VSVLCEIAIDAIERALTGGVRSAPVLDSVPPLLREPAATFVTLERGERLLGCIGTLDARMPLAVDVAEHALAAAFDDPRLPPLTLADFPEMSVKVSVLSRSEPIDIASFGELRDAIRPGVDGLTVEMGSAYRATLLPSVWEKVRGVDDFLAALWVKAGLAPRSWPPSIRVSCYTTVEECDPGPRPHPSSRRLL
jgi:AmmeMemoRadiSam system protein A